MNVFFKRIAGVLLTVLLIFCVIPVQETNAAAVPGLKYTSRVVYIDGSKANGYTDNCWIPSVNIAGYTMTYEVISNKDFITVTKNGKVTVTGNGVGAAIVKVTYSKSSQKDITAKFTVKIRRNAATVKLTDASTGKLDQPMKVGDRVTFQAAKSYDSSYKKGHYGLDNYRKVVTDSLSIESLTPNIATANGMTITAVAPGTAQFVVKAYQYIDNLPTGVQSHVYSIVVESPLTVTQATTKRLILKTSSIFTAEPSLSSFSLQRSGTNEVVEIKKVALDTAEKNTVYIETYAEMTDGKEYKLTFEGKSCSFIATDGKITDVSFTPIMIPAETPTEVYVQLLDAKGVILNEYSLENYVNHPNLDFKVISIDGYVTGSKFVMNKSGSTAKVSAVYHTYQYDSYGNEIGAIVREVILVGVEPKPITFSSQYTIAKTLPNYETLADASVNKQIAVLDRGYNVYFYMKNSYGEDISAEYTLHSSNPDAFIVEATQPAMTGIYASVLAVSDKYTNNQIIVKKGDLVVAVLPLTITPPRVYTALEIPAETLSFSLTNRVQQKIVVPVICKDQYGGIMEDEIPVVSCVLAPNAGAKTVVEANYLSYANAEPGKVTFNALGLVAGTYQYKITIGNYSRVVTVIVQEPVESLTSIYRVILSAATVDTIVPVNNAVNKDIAIMIGEYKGNVLYRYLTVASTTVMEVKHADGTVVTTSNDGVSTWTVNALNVNTNPVTKIKTGGYTISVVSEGKSFTSGFTVTDSQGGLTVGRVSTTAAPSTWATVLKNAFDFSYNGADVDDYIASVSYTGIVSDNNCIATNYASAGSYYINSVTLNIPFGNGLTVPFTVQVSRSLVIQ